MDTIGAYQAKTHLPQLLERVAQGETIAITRHGVPVAMLIPHPLSRRSDPVKAINSLREFRRGLSLGGLSVRELVGEGRC